MMASGVRRSLHTLIVPTSRLGLIPPPGAAQKHNAVTLFGMRITVFRRLMAEEFGALRAETLASDHVFRGLGERTIDEALAAGVPAKEIWRQVCDEFAIPPERR